MSAITPAIALPRGPYVLMHSGATLNLLGRRNRSDWSLLDLAEHLCKINRWNGGTVRPNSVAEHSLLVVEIMEREVAIHSPEVLLAALLHDAQEACFGDITKPVKRALGFAATDVEVPLQIEVLTVFKAVRAARIHGSAIKHCDDMAAATELRDLFPQSPARDEILANMPAPPVTWINLRQRDGLCWQDWRQAFLDRFAALYGAVAGIDPERVPLGQPLEA